MKKTLTIIGAIILIASLTGLRLYKKHQKTQIIKVQDALQKEQVEKIIYQQKEAKIAKYKDEEKRRNDSIAKLRQDKLKKGLQMLKEAKENLREE